MLPIFILLEAHYCWVLFIGHCVAINSGADDVADGMFSKCFRMNKDDRGLNSRSLNERVYNQLNYLRLSDIDGFCVKAEDVKDGKVPHFCGSENPVWRSEN